VCLSVLTTLLLTACAGIEVSPGATPELDDRHGLVGIVVDAPTAIDRISFAPSGGGSVLVELGRVAPVDDLRLLRLPAGTYCLDEIEYDVIGMGNTEGVCFEVVAEHLRYPGHLVIERVEDLHLTHQARFVWEVRDDAYQSLLLGKWPQLAAAPPHPAEDDFVPPEPEHDAFAPDANTEAE